MYIQKAVCELDTQTHEWSVELLYIFKAKT